MLGRGGFVRGNTLGILKSILSILGLLGRFNTQSALNGVENALITAVLQIILERLLTHQIGGGIAEVFLDNTLSLDEGVRECLLNERVSGRRERRRIETARLQRANPRTNRRGTGII